MVEHTTEAPDCAGRNGAHTPGPWVACYTYGPDEKDGTITIDADEWGCLARVVVRMDGERENSPEGDANARLIAAAPELLEALREAETVIDALDHSGYSHGDVLATIRSVIARATGAA